MKVNEVTLGFLFRVIRESGHAWTRTKRRGRRITIQSQFTIHSQFIPNLVIRRERPEIAPGYEKNTVI